MTVSIIIGTRVDVAAPQERVPLVVYRSETGNEPVRDWLLEMSKADRRVVGIGLKELEFGWPVGMPLCRAMGAGIFELRVSLASRRIARVLVCANDDKLVALHGFIKKSQKTPAGDLDLARKRKRQLERVK